MSCREEFLSCRFFYLCVSFSLQIRRVILDSATNSVLLRINGASDSIDGGSRVIREGKVYMTTGFDVKKSLHLSGCTTKLWNMKLASRKVRFCTKTNAIKVPFVKILHSWEIRAIHENSQNVRLTEADLTWIQSPMFLSFTKDKSQGNSFHSNTWLTWESGLTPQRRHFSRKYIKTDKYETRKDGSSWNLRARRLVVKENIFAETETSNCIPFEWMSLVYLEGSRVTVCRLH